MDAAAIAIATRVTAGEGGATTRAGAGEVTSAATSMCVGARPSSRAFRYPRDARAARRGGDVITPAFQSG
jgi:hypothetical protein|eukprot:9633-Pelagococcus_subviridis.AAC.1